MFIILLSVWLNLWYTSYFLLNLIFSVGSSVPPYLKLQLFSWHSDPCPYSIIFYSTIHHLNQFSSVQLLSCVWLFATQWTATRQASLSITNAQSPLKPTSIESVMPSNRLILCRPLHLLPPNPSQHPGLFQWVNTSHEVAKILEFQLQHQSFQWTPRTDLL